MTITRKPCTKCKEIKPLSDFPICKRMKLGVGSWCRKCKAGLDKMYAENHPDRVKLAKSKYYENNREKALHRSKKWDKDNPKLARQRHARWGDKNKEKLSLYAHKRRMLVKNAGGRGVSKADWDIIISIYGNKCLKCGSTERITVDHVIPLDLGGIHDPVNIQPLCHSCNSGKQARNCDDYRPSIDRVISIFGFLSL